MCGQGRGEMIMPGEALSKALERLARRFETLPWTFSTVRRGRRDEIVRLWPGSSDEDIMVCVLRNFDFHERLHRQDYYFFNYTYKGSYQAFCDRSSNVVTIHEGECHVGQPFSGYGIRQDAESRSAVVGVLIRKELFYRDFLPVVSSAPAIFRFFIDPQQNEFSTEYLRFAFPDDSPVKMLLEMMVIEYSDPKEETQAMLKSLTAALLLQIARRYREVSKSGISQSVSDKMVAFIGEHLGNVSLDSIGKHFFYNSTYVSNLLKSGTGRTFSEILLRLRMERAVMLMKGTTLSNEEIADMLGYSNTSNFYKAFRQYFGISPREYLHIMA